MAIQYQIVWYREPGMNELCAKRTTRYTRSPHLHTRPQQYVYIINNLHTSNCVPGIYGQQYWWGPMVHPHIVKTTCQAAISRKLANFSAMPIHLKMLRQKITWTRHDWEMGMVGNQQVCVCVCLAFCRWRTWVFVLKLNCVQSSQPRIMSKRTHYIAVSLLSPIDLMNSLWRRFS